MNRLSNYLALVSVGVFPYLVYASDPAPVEKTGQAKCFSATAEIPCAGTGQDGDLQTGVQFPTPRFTDLGNGIVRDNLTGLGWLKDASCASLPGTDADGRADWLGALSAANNLEDGVCGLTDASSAGDWRLPNANEIMSLVHFGHYLPPLQNTQGNGQWSSGDPFVGIDSTYAYWTSTTNPSLPSEAMSVGLGWSGRQYEEHKDSLRTVWPVIGPIHDGGSEIPAPVGRTGQQACYSLTGEIPCPGSGQDGDIQAGIPISWPRFTDMGNGVVRDNQTGLEWLKDSMCPDQPNGAWQDWLGALTWVNNLTDGLCGLSDGSEVGDWRLPNVRELLSIVHRAYHHPSISNSEGTARWGGGDPFRDFMVPQGYYWTSTTVPGDASSAFVVVLGDQGISLPFVKTFRNEVWAVKGRSASSNLFTDGFESSDTTSWSHTSP